eukprot:CAMPEP_0183777572 /NCGR_PEP_ID=MMETSP0739-20130205/49376_1 /TAXON_ID=385413 /ORGANISM="Thalassiosira miniscula, Strain CCMP1093" /LENGTH=201 /DNA_ID=CAMNT_0026019733 /DNA_START=40 /DNA_END=642 /DNA_ORIENTATION=+
MAQDAEEAAINRLRRTPLSWEELETIILSPNVEDLSKLARNEEQTKTYRKRRAEIKHDWVSIYDYLLCTKFDFGWVWADVPPESSGGRDQNNLQHRQKRSTPAFEEILNDQKRPEHEKEHGLKLKLCINDFPYYLAPGIEHFVLWKLGGDVTPDEIVKAKLDILKDSQLWTTMNDPSSNRIERHKNLEKAIVYDHAVFLHW